jgi:type I restriction enzyme, S subunit
MSNWPTIPLKGLIVEVSLRKGDKPADVFSVTNSDGFVRSLEVFDKQVFSQDTSNYKLVKYNDIAYNPSRINVGSVALCHFRDGGAVSPMYVVVRCQESLRPQYLLYFLKSEIGRQYIKHRSVGAVRFQLRYSDLEQIELPIPPFSEQERIVEILDEVERSRQMRQQADRRTASLIPAIFHGMFADGLAFPKRKLAEVCEFITKGTTPKASEIKDRAEDGDVPFLKVYHVTDNGEIDFHNNPAFINSSLHNGLLARSKVYPNDVLMNIVGPPLGKIGIVHPEYPEWNINQALAIFRARENLEPVYLLHVLRSPHVLTKILAQAAGIRQLNVSLEQCRNIEIPLPPLSLQRAFEARVEEVRALRRLQAESRQRLHDLFEKLISRAFQGEL